jgi:hypothetical protein
VFSAGIAISLAVIEEPPAKFPALAALSEPQSPGASAQTAVLMAPQAGAASIRMPVKSPALD